MADSSLLGLTTATSATSSDYIYLLRSPYGSGADRKITLTDFEASLNVANLIGYSSLATSAQGAKADTALQPASNLSDVSNAATARTNLGLNRKTPEICLATNFETAGRFGLATYAGTAASLTSGGLYLHSNGNTNYAKCLWDIGAYSSFCDYFAGSPSFSASIGFEMNLAADGQCVFLGLGSPTVAAAGITLTDNIVGFYIVRETGVVNVYGNIGQGGVSTKTLLTTYSANTFIDLYFVINASASATFFYRKYNDAAWSAGTTVTHAIPAFVGSSGAYASFCISSGAAADEVKARIPGACYKR